MAKGNRRRSRRSFLHAAGFVSAGLLVGTATGQQSSDVRSIAYGETVRSRLDDSDPTGYRGHYEPVTFRGTAGDVVTIRMDGDGFSDPYLMLAAPGGDIVAENDDDYYYGDFLDSRIARYRLQSTGEYTIIATSYGDDATFGYSLGLERVDAGDTSTPDRTPTMTATPGDGHRGGGQDLRSIEYGETLSGAVDAADPTGYRGHYEPVTFRGTAGDVVTITMDGDGDPYLMLEGPGGDIVAENDDDYAFADFYDSRIQAFRLPATGEYTIIATTYDETATLTYDLGLERADSGETATPGAIPTRTPTPGDGGGGQDLRSIEYGETLSGAVDASDPTGYRGHYEPVTFRGTAGDIVTIRMDGDGDPYLMLRGPGGEIIARNDDDPDYADFLDSRIQGFQLPSTGEYTIIATTYDETATLTYDLGLERVGSGRTSTPTPGGGTGRYLSGTVVDVLGNPVEDAYVAAYYRAGSGGDGVLLIAESRTDAEGVFSFDGTDLATDDAQGVALPRDSVGDIEGRFSRGYGQGVTLVAVEPIAVDGHYHVASPDLWFGTATLDADAFFDAGFDRTLTLDHQRNFHATLGDEQQAASEVLVSREVDPDDHNDQTIYTEVRGRHSSQSRPVDLIRRGTFSVQVPEDITVQYEGSDNGVYVPPSDTYPFSLPALYSRGAFESLPVEPVSEFVEPSPPPGGDTAAGDALQGTIGFIPGVGDVVGFISTVRDVFDMGEGPPEIVETVGGGSTYDPNRADLVRGALPDAHAVATQSVSLTVPDESTTFAARATWTQHEHSTLRYSLDHQMELGGAFSARQLPGHE